MTTEKFYWGAATASYQVEGSPLADGGGRCIWDEFAHTPGTISDGTTGDVAADHYHRWREDIGLIAALGLNAYRFSVRWPRVLPEGEGQPNKRGLSFYDRLVDGLLSAGVEPFVTLYHWDLPAALLRLGGWANPDIAGWFADYTASVAAALGDRVNYWVTLNEPFVVASEGHLAGAHAPGLRNIYHACHSLHNQLRAHAASHRVLQSLAPGAQVGLALHNAAVWPASDNPEDLAAAERAEAWHNFPMFLGPLVHGAYPEAIEGRLAPYLPQHYGTDMEEICLAPDFVGLNYYFGYLARHSEHSWLGFEALQDPAIAKTAMGWGISPEGLYRVITQAHDAYKLPAIYVTENGAAFPDSIANGAVHDPDRTAYLRSHVSAALKAREAGAPVKGYFVWSLLDNFEWAHGYTKRFGLVYVDYATQRRVVKDSGWWYAKLARTGEPPEI
jgi:beta-glucosidase